MFNAAHNAVLFLLGFRLSLDRIQQRAPFVACSRQPRQIFD
jgi:hypothetical protein